MKHIVTQIVIEVAAGIILGLGATLFWLLPELASMKEQVATLKDEVATLRQNKEQIQSQPTQNSSNTIPEPIRSARVKPELLAEIIMEQQRKNIKESYGEQAYQCFTDEDLRQFVQNETPQKVTDALKWDNRFIDLVLAIKDMNPSDRQKFLNSCLRPLRQTWAQLGRISPEGQTEAGQRAEMMIATSIVDLAKNLVSLSVEDIKKLYTN